MRSNITIDVPSKAARVRRFSTNELIHAAVFQLYEPSERTA
jgi:hypothetical protein